MEPAPTVIYTLSLHDALPICRRVRRRDPSPPWRFPAVVSWVGLRGADSLVLAAARSEEHTSELQSRQYLVCRLLLEKKKKQLLLQTISTQRVIKLLTLITLLP